MNNHYEIPNFSAEEVEYLNQAFSQISRMANYKASLEYFINSWARMVYGIAKGADIELADLEEVLTKRNIIKNVVDAGPRSLAPKLDPLLIQLDSIFFSNTIEASKPISRFYSPEDYPWWKRIPKVVNSIDVRTPYVARRLIAE
jgi:hypothetical protein